MNPYRLYAKPEVAGNIGNWQERHVNAVLNPKVFEKSIVQGIDAWVNYALAHEQKYESPIGEDRVIGEYWKDWGLALRRLLDGETGRLDCGTLYHVIAETMRECGIDPEVSE